MHSLKEAAALVGRREVDVLGGVFSGPIYRSGKMMRGSCRSPAELIRVYCVSPGDNSGRRNGGALHQPPVRPCVSHRRDQAVTRRDRIFATVPFFWLPSYSHRNRSLP